MKPQITRLSAWLSLVIVSGYVVCPTISRADATGIAGGPGSGPIANNAGAKLQPFQVLGLVKQAVGQVERREPIQDDKFGPATQCKKGDQLLEGSLVETGNKSFADLSWSGTTSRLWQNSIIRILPCAKTVHLVNGGLMFYKSRNCKDTECIVETKRLQARIRGTSVRFLSGTDVDSILVQEMGGKDAVEVYNKINGSKVSLAVGVVLEIRGKVSSPDARFNLKSEASEDRPTANLKLNPSKGELIFQDKLSQTVAYTANAKAVLEDPMLLGQDGHSAFDSIDLIRAAMTKVPSSDNVIGNLIESAFNGGKPDKLISRNFKILTVPTKTAYYIGPNVGSDKSIPMPNLAYTDFPPGGVIAALSSSGTTHAMGSMRVSAPVALPMIHEQTPPAESQALDMQEQITSGMTQSIPPTPAEMPAVLKVLPATPVTAMEANGAPLTVATPLESTKFASGTMRVVPFKNGVADYSQLNNVVSKSDSSAITGRAN